ncbi:MAG: hypothetical protein K0Q49_2441 [Haloplasmataceae bacterium]|jgi:hypothetical protein|nr:hypothetical protein [Haloplasmataceae bacterium]
MVPTERIQSIHGIYVYLFEHDRFKLSHGSFVDLFKSFNCEHQQIQTRVLLKERIQLIFEKVRSSCHKSLLN